MIARRAASAAHGGDTRPRQQSRAPMRAGRRSTIWCSAAGVRRAAARPRSRRPSGSAGASSKSASAPAFRCRIIRARNRIVGIDISAPMLRKAQERVARAKLENVEALAVMDAAASRASRTASSTWWSRNTSSPRCPIPKARSMSSRACCARRRDHPGQSHRRRERAARGVRTRLRAAGAAARLAAGISAGPGSTAMGRTHGGVRLIERRPMPPLGHFSLIRFERLRQ